MAETIDPGRPDRATWRVPTAILIVGVAIAWTALRFHDRLDDFPSGILQAMGVALAALVFSLGFAQQGLRRTLEEAVKEARRRDGALIAAATADDSGISTLRLMQLTYSHSSDARDAAELAFKRQPWELAAIARRYTRWPEQSLERSNLMISLAWASAPIEDADNDPPDPKAIARGEERLRKVDQEWQAVARAAGHVGYTSISGSITTGAGAAYNTMSMGLVFVVAMWGLALVGGTATGWSDLRASAVDLYVIATFLGLAHAYVFVVRHDFAVQLAQAAQQLGDLPLVQLLTTEQLITIRSGTGQSDLTSEGMRDVWASEVTWRLERHEPELDGLAWYESLRGRSHLARALTSHELDTRDFELSRARHRLERALSDDEDPIALIALARVEELGQSGGGTNARSPELVERAIRVLRESRASAEPYPNDFAAAFAMTSWEWARSVLDDQRWCWPTEPRLVAEFEDIISTTTRPTRRTARRKART